MRLAQEAEKVDGVQRVFRITADDVAKEVPSYARFVKGEVAKLGANHPLIKTQYYSQEIDAETGMFPPERRALMRGVHPPLDSPPFREGLEVGGAYAFLLDVAGEDESPLDPTSNVQSPTSRDSTALTIVRIDLSLLELLRAPRYLVVHRRLWTGVKHTTIFGQLVALAEAWEPRRIVCDATGVGAGLTSFLAKALGEGRVEPFIFSSASKSKLGWDFLSVIETGRFKEYCEAGIWNGEAQTANRENLQQVFWQQVEFCQMEILPGPGRTMRWGAPDGRRDPATGEFLHDDLLVSAALCAVLDRFTWGLAESAVVHSPDPLQGFCEVF
jgi:hypothetical protein